MSDPGHIYPCMCTYVCGCTAARSNRCVSSFVGKLINVLTRYAACAHLVQARQQSKRAAITTYCVLSRRFFRSICASVGASTW